MEGCRPLSNGSSTSTTRVTRVTPLKGIDELCRAGRMSILATAGAQSSPMAQEDAQRPLQAGEGSSNGDLPGHRERRWRVLLGNARVWDPVPGVDRPRGADAGQSQSAAVLHLRAERASSGPRPQLLPCTTRDPPGFEALLARQSEYVARCLREGFHAEQALRPLP